MIIPLRGPLEDEAENFSYLGARTLMFCVLQGKPGTRTTFGTCVDSSSGNLIHPVEVGSLIKFLTPESLLIAKGLLMVAVEKFMREAENTVPKCGEKRQRQELLEDSGE